MDLHPSHERINIANNVLNTTIIQEEAMEMIVPDALPDILRIISADATVLVRGKETDTGRVSVSGVAAATIVYSPEGISGARKINVDVPFTISAAESDITSMSKVTASISAVTTEASVINPRKLSVKVELRAELACYNDDEILLSTDVEAAEETGVEILRESRTVRTPMDVKEKSFVITDELALPNSGPEIGEILRTRVMLTPEEAKVVGNKLIFRGNTSISLLYSTADAELYSTELSSEFSQIMELEGVSEESDFDISLMLTGAYFEPGGADNAENKSLGIELHVVAQCVAAEKRSVPFISDIYSTKYKLSRTVSELELVNRENAGRQSTVFRGTLETGTEASRVVAIGVNTGAAQYEADGSGMMLKAPLYVTAIYISDDGRILSAAGRFEAEATAEMRYDCKYDIRAECGKEVYGAASNNGIELRIPVDFNVVETSTVKMSTIAEISYDEESPLDTSRMPSLMLSRAKKGDTLWKLAKKHNSTVSLILSANGVDSEDELTAAQMLIIPKKR